MRNVLVLLLVVAVSSGASGQALRRFCTAAEKPVRDDSNLFEAVRAAFGPVTYDSAADECIYPLRVVRYASAEVLLTQGNVPGNACHGCEAHLSAYVLRPVAGDLKLIKRLPDFAEVGSFGTVQDVAPLKVGDDDGLVLQGGGTFQGYSFTTLDFYAFRTGRVVHLAADPQVIVDADDTGAKDDLKDTVTVKGSWSLTSGAKASLIVEYRIEARGKRRVRKVVWALDGDRLRLQQGPIPPEVKEASGG